MLCLFFSGLMEAYAKVQFTLCGDVSPFSGYLHLAPMSSCSECRCLGSLSSELGLDPRAYYSAFLLSGWPMMGFPVSTSSKRKKVFGLDPEHSSEPQDSPKDEILPML